MKTTDRMMTDRLYETIGRGDVVYLSPRDSNFAWPMRIERGDGDHVIGRVRVPRTMLRFRAREGSLVAERGDVPSLDGTAEAYEAQALARRGQCGAARALIARAGNSVAAEYARDQIEESCMAQERPRGVRFDGSTRRRQKRTLATGPYNARMRPGEAVISCMEVGSAGKSGAKALRRFIRGMKKDSRDVYTKIREVKAHAANGKRIACLVGKVR